MNQQDRLLYLKRIAQESASLRQAVIEQLGPKIIELANLMSGVIGSGGKILVAGNGGMATAASRFVSELVVRLQTDRQRQALPALALCADPAVMTASAEAYGYENIFARQIQGLARRGDMLFVLAESGESATLLKAVQIAREQGVLTAGLLGGKAGRLASSLESALIVPHPSPMRVQEEHVFIIHLMVEMIESDLFA